jgi:F420H(2)-dependent quinone reductase
MTEPATAKAVRPIRGVEKQIAEVAIWIMSRANTWIFRATGGRLGSKFMRGAPVCLVTMKGRKTGQRRTVPLIYLQDGRDYVIVASKGGMDEHPLWYLNLVANPDAEVEIGTDRIPVRARTASPAEKGRLWPRLLEIYPDYADYQRRTERQIPVVVLEPV